MTLLTSSPRKFRLVMMVLAVVLVIAGLALAQILVQSQQRHYPDVGLRDANAIQMNYLHEGLATASQCAAQVQTVTRIMVTACPDCVLVHARCTQRLSPRQSQLLSGQPIDEPVMRISHALLSFKSIDPEHARQTCIDTARKAGRSTRCDSPDTLALATALASVSPTQLEFVPSVRTLALLTLFSTLISFLICWIIILTERWHGRYSHDAVQSGPQKFHAVAVPRIGGVAIAIAIAAAVCSLGVSGMLSTAAASSYALLALAALPAFAGGLTEDLTKKVGVMARLLLTMTAGVLASLLVGATLNNLDVPGLDNLLNYWPLFAIAFTAFAVGGVANAINIIDGYNGLVGGYAIIVLAALAWVSVQVDDQVVLIASLTMLGAMAGFLVWNWPGGKIFLGDGGAYLLGFWLAELGVLLVVRNPQVSPWFPLVLMAYPIFETLFSIYRKTLLRGHSSGRPDGLHLHMLIYKRLLRHNTCPYAPHTKTQRNSAVAMYVWAVTVAFSATAVLFWNRTLWLLISAFAFSALYIWLYSLIVRFHTPSWLISTLANLEKNPNT